MWWGHAVTSERQDAGRMALFSQYSVAAAEQALDDAGWRPDTDAQRERTVRAHARNDSIIGIFTDDKLAGRVYWLWHR